MILGDPYNFAILFSKVKTWNLDDTFCNGVLFLGVDGEIFPKRFITATLKSEIIPLKEKLENIVKDEQLFETEKEKAFKHIYEITFPEDIEVMNDYRFDITPPSFEEDDCYVFGVSNGELVKILAAKLEYVIGESRHNLDGINVREAILSLAELKDIAYKLFLY